MNAFELGFNQNEYFYYQIGEIFTEYPWIKPNYNVIYNLLSNSEFLKILNNFHSYIIGRFLWDFKTNDFDLYLIPKNNMNYNKLENYINTLNDISLNNYRILLDITISNENHILPSKKELINNINNKIYLKKIKMIKIGYYKKIIGNIETTIDFDYFNKTKNAIKLNNRYLIEYISSGFNDKIKTRILMSKKEKLINYLNINDFLLMNENEFLKIQNY
jgi:hypothetical protein